MTRSCYHLCASTMVPPLSLLSRTLSYTSREAEQQINFFWGDNLNQETKTKENKNSLSQFEEHSRTLHQNIISNFWIKSEPIQIPFCINLTTQALIWELRSININREVVFQKKGGKGKTKFRTISDNEFSNNLTTFKPLNIRTSTRKPNTKIYFPPRILKPRLN